MPRRINLKGRTLAILGAVVALVVGGFGAASLASASGSVTTLCAKSGTRQVYDFSPCPAGFFSIAVGSGSVGVTAPQPTVTVTATPTTVGGSGGSAAAGTFLIEGNTPKTVPTIVTVTAPEAWFSANPDAYTETFSTNAASAPIGKTITVKPLTGVEPLADYPPATGSPSPSTSPGSTINPSIGYTGLARPSNGSSERTFAVWTSGFKAGESFSLTIGVTDNP